MRTIKAICLVCHSWRSAALPTLYKTIYLHQVGQLPALLRTLEESRAASVDGDNAGYGRYVSFIRCDYFVPKIWTQLHHASIQKVLVLCTSLKDFTYVPINEDWNNGSSSQHDTALRFVDMNQAIYKGNASPSLTNDLVPAITRFSSLSGVHVNLSHLDILSAAPISLAMESLHL